MKKRLISVVLVIQLLLVMSCSFAEEITPRADLVFQNATAASAQVSM